jgi:DNA-binding MarR family transcriptional regulator
MTESDLLNLTEEIQIYAALLLKFFNASLDERLRARGMTISTLQHSILRMLSQENLTISDISVRLGIEPSTVLRSLDALERKGLARRGKDRHDRRRNPLSLTEAGRQLLADFPVVSTSDPAYRALVELGQRSGEELRDLLRAYIVQSPDGGFVVSLLEAQEKDHLLEKKNE